MAYRRRNSYPRSPPPPPGEEDFTSPMSPRPDEAEQLGLRPSLAAQAIRASSGFRESSLSSAYTDSPFSDGHREVDPSPRSVMAPQDPNAYEDRSIKYSDQPKYGFWGALTRKAKSIIEDDNPTEQHKNCNRNKPQHESSKDSQLHQMFPGGQEKSENPKLRKSLNAISSSFNYIGGKVGNALEEGISIVESRTSDIFQETRKLNSRRKTSTSNMRREAAFSYLNQQNTSHDQANQEIQLKAARDVANAMAAKAKLLMRELKTVKADLAFAKERCAQLEEENTKLRESRVPGAHPEDDDLIRLQLETLLSEKARLAHENSIHTRENRFLREIVEYHQLRMQDVVYLNESTEEVTEIYPVLGSFSADGHSGSPNSKPWTSSHGNLASSLPVPVAPASVRSF